MMRAAACVSMCAAALAVVDAQRPTFSSRLEAVRVDVSVTERGRPVAGLAAADFEVFDNGVRQDVTLIATEDVPIDLVLALDTSDSVAGERLQHLRSASQVALRALAKQDRAALLTFSERVVVRTPLTGDLAGVEDAIEDDGRARNTSVIDAAYAALVQADAGSGRALAIVLSDGVDTASWLTAASVIETAKRLDVVLFGIATGAPRQTPLDAIADASGGDLIRIESTRSLAATIRTLIETFRQRYLLSFVPRDVPRAGWHKLEVRMTRRGLVARTRQGYFGS